MVVVILIAAFAAAAILPSSLSGSHFHFKVYPVVCTTIAVIGAFTIAKFLRKNRTKSYPS